MKIKSIIIFFIIIILIWQTLIGLGVYSILGFNYSGINEIIVNGFYYPGRYELKNCEEFPKIEEIKKILESNTEKINEFYSRIKNVQALNKLSISSCNTERGWVELYLPTYRERVVFDEIFKDINFPVFIYNY